VIDDGGNQNKKKVFRLLHAIFLARKKKKALVAVAMRCAGKQFSPLTSC